MSTSTYFSHSPPQETHCLISPIYGILVVYARTVATLLEKQVMVFGLAKHLIATTMLQLPNHKKKKTRKTTTP